jgi:hypothetical protein
MADVNSFAPGLQAFSKRLDTLRSRGQAIRAALGTTAPPAKEPTKELPSLKGEALARHHLALAIDAMRAPGVSKPESFRKLRLLLNILEQGAHKSMRPDTKPVVVTPPALLSRRARLLNKAFESAHLVSAWRNTDAGSSRQSQL